MATSKRRRRRPVEHPSAHLGHVPPGLHRRQQRELVPHRAGVGEGVVELLDVRAQDPAASASPPRSSQEVLLLADVREVPDQRAHERVRAGAAARARRGRSGAAVRSRASARSRTTVSMSVMPAPLRRWPPAGRPRARARGRGQDGVARAAAGVDHSPRRAGQGAVGRAPVGGGRQAGAGGLVQRDRPGRGARRRSSGRRRPQASAATSAATGSSSSVAVSPASAGHAGLASR